VVAILARRKHDGTFEWFSLLSGCAELNIDQLLHARAGFVFLYTSFPNKIVGLNILLYRPIILLNISYWLVAETAKPHTLCEFAFIYKLYLWYPSRFNTIGPHLFIISIDITLSIISIIYSRYRSHKDVT